MPNTLSFVYTTTRKRFVIFTCRYFKLSWNTTALSQSNYRNFSCSSINAKISFWFRSLNGAYRKHTGIYISAWNVSCCAQFACRLTKEPLAGSGTFKRSGHFLWCRIFGKARKLSVCHNLISNMLRKLTGQISAHYSSFGIKNTHLRLFRPDQGPHVYCSPQIWCIKSTNGWFTCHQICRQDFVIKANLSNTKHPAWFFSILASLLDRGIQPINCNV